MRVRVIAIGRIECLQEREAGLLSPYCFTATMLPSIPGMEAARRITIHVPAELLRRAQEATGEGITPTIRKALELVAASSSYEEVRRLRGKVPLGIDLKKLREDR